MKTVLIPYITAPPPRQMNKHTLPEMKQQVLCELGCQTTGVWTPTLASH